MKLSRLRLRDFRGFKELDLEFGPDVTVLVGVNGAGKTSILDAVALAMSCFTEGMRTANPKGFELSLNDLRTGASSASVTVSAEVAGMMASWNATKTRPGYAEQGSETFDQLNAAITAARLTPDNPAPRLPVVVYFPTNRNALDIPARIRTPHEFDILSAYDGALDSGASSFRGFFGWFREEEDLFNEQQVLFATNKSEEPQQISRLPLVRSAIEALFPGATQLRMERRPQRMTVLLNGVRLDVAQLSDGEKCLLAMVGDLARRMVLAAPAAEKPLEQPAVVLIDELELHLHPGLQRQILPRLRRVFPNTQFVVSTHSPQVLSSVHAANVRLLEHFELGPLDRGTWRRDTNRILEAVFGDPGRPPEVAEKINQLRDAVDDNRFEEARSLVSELRNMIEGEDPDVFYLEQLIPPAVQTKEH